MPTRTIKTGDDAVSFHAWLANMPMPYTISVTKGVKRSWEQNRLQRLWVAEVSAQLGDRTPEEARGEGKLHIGVPILRAESPEFAEIYDKLIRPLPYEQKLALMMVPIDLPVTSKMTTKQKTAFLDGLHNHWSEQGVQLTQPEGAE